MNRVVVGRPTPLRQAIQQFSRQPTQASQRPANEQTKTPSRDSAKPTEQRSQSRFEPFRPTIGGGLPPLLAATPVGKKWDSLSDQERGFVAHNPLLAAKYQDAADKADQLSSAFANKHLQGTAADIRGDSDGNALRHATWNALMVARAANPDFVNPSPGMPPPSRETRHAQAVASARWLADAHEANPRNTIEHNKRMDLLNNEVGRQVALEQLRAKPDSTDEDLFLAVTRAYQAGRLVRVQGADVVAIRPSTVGQ